MYSNVNLTTDVVSVSHSSSFIPSSPQSLSLTLLRKSNMNLHKYFTIFRLLSPTPNMCKYICVLKCVLKFLKRLKISNIYMTSKSWYNVTTDLTIKVIPNQYENYLFVKFFIGIHEKLRMNWLKTLGFSFFFCSVITSTTTPNI